MVTLAGATNAHVHQHAVGLLVGRRRGQGPSNTTLGIRILVIDLVRLVWLVRLMLMMSKRGCLSIHIGGSGRFLGERGNGPGR
jgi:hypothetical protein